MTGDARHPRGVRQLLRGDLVAHRRNRLGPRPDERHAGLGERSRKDRVFREEAVAGMNRFGAGRAAGLDDPLDLQIALG